MATGSERARGAGGLREAKEMIISKRTVGPQQLRPRRDFSLDLSCKGGGVRGGGKAVGIAARLGRSGLREAKEMIISKRTVGPEHWRTPRDFSLDRDGRGRVRGGETVRDRRPGGPAGPLRISKIVLPSRRGAHF